MKNKSARVYKEGAGVTRSGRGEVGDLHYYVEKRQVSRDAVTVTGGKRSISIKRGATEQQSDECRRNGSEYEESSDEEKRGGGGKKATRKVAKVGEKREQK